MVPEGVGRIDRRPMTPRRRRARALLLLIVGSLLTVVGVGGLLLAGLQGRLGEVGGVRSVPIWLSMSVAVAFGALLLWAGVRLRARGSVEAE